MLSNIYRTKTHKTMHTYNLEFFHVYDGLLALADVVLDVSHVVPQGVNLLHQLRQVHYFLHQQSGFNRSVSNECRRRLRTCVRVIDWALTATNVWLRCC